MNKPSALVSAAGGIGDIVRMTPLIRALASLGYEVDVLLAPDYLGTVKLLEGAPEIRKMFYVPSQWSKQTERDIDGLRDRPYDIATFTVWSARLRDLVVARRVLTFDQREWIQEGDSSCSRRLAEEMGWRGPLPEPFVIPSNMDFGLPPGTVALHPGCKPGWPWKKWHGFEELACGLSNVVIVGTESDNDNHGTYFGRRFEWPSHAKDYTGKLSIEDTAALIGQCAALVSNDSGLMHIGVAMGTPTLGVFGLTSPAREMIPATNMIAVTKELACEPGCRRQPWGRRDCAYHLECLKTLSAEDVLARLEVSGVS
jgi:ADP-heptose:LPS heptosyltransferase